MVLELKEYTMASLDYKLSYTTLISQTKQSPHLPYNTNTRPPSPFSPYPLRPLSSLITSSPFSSLNHTFFFSLILKSLTPLRFLPSPSVFFSFPDPPPFVSVSPASHGGPASSGKYSGELKD